jgi:hypothetical protein
MLTPPKNADAERERQEVQRFLGLHLGFGCTKNRRAKICKSEINKLSRARIALLKTHANLVADAEPSSQLHIANTASITPKKRKDAWEEFMELTDFQDAGPTSDSGRAHIYDVDTEVRLYCETAVVSDRKVKALDWWKTHWEEYPTLSVLARDWLAVTASSVPCESLFSIAGNTITPNRNRLNPETAQAILCLKSWWEFGKDLGH